MDDDRFETRWRRHHQAPGERDRPVGRGTPPARRLVRDAQPRRSNPHLPGVHGDHLFGNGAGATTQPGDESDPHQRLARRHALGNDDVAIGDRDGANRSGTDAMRAARVRNGPAHGDPTARPERCTALRNLCKRSFDPPRSFDDECLDLTSCALDAEPRGNDCLKATLGIDVQRQTASAAASDQRVRMTRRHAANRIVATHRSSHHGHQSRTT